MITPFVLVSHQVTHGPMVLQLPQLLARQHNTHNAPKGTYMPYIQLHPIEMLIWHYTFVHPCWRPVAQVHEGGHCLGPEVRQEVRITQHCVCAISGYTDKLFGDSV